MSAIVNEVVNAAAGFSYSFPLTFLNAAEKAAQRGSNPILVGLLQAGQAVQLNIQMDLLRQTYSQQDMPLYITVPVMAISPLLQLAQWSFENVESLKQNVPSLIKKSITWLNENFGTIYQIASAVTAIALFVLGQHVIAVVMLADLTFRVLDSYQLLPTVVSKTYWLIAPWLALGGSFLTPSIFMKISSAIAVCDRIANTVSALLNSSTPYEKSEHPSKLFYGGFEKIIDHTMPLEWNRKHVAIEPFPVFSSPNYDSLIQFNQEFAWEDPACFQQLEIEIENDPRWKKSKQYDELQNAPTENHKQLKIAYVRERFNLVITSVQNENIEAGSDIDYCILKNYVGCISEYLPKADKNMQTQIMLQLSTEGGDRCSSGIYYQLETASIALLSGTSLSKNPEERKRLPLKQRVMIVLQQERLRAAQGLYKIMESRNPLLPKVLGGDGIVHPMNKFINLFASTFGLPEHGASNDLTAKAMYMEKWLFRFLLGINSEDLWKDGDESMGFYKGYTPEKGIEKIQDMIGTPILPQIDIYTWAREWIKHQQVSEDTKEQFLESLTSNASFENTNGSMKREFLQAMLFDMGILQQQ